MRKKQPVHRQVEWLVLATLTLKLLLVLANHFLK